MKLAQINEAQYYQAKSLRTILQYFDQVELRHDNMSGASYEPKEGMYVVIIERTKATIFQEQVSAITTDRTGVWVDYEQGHNGDWTNEEYLSKFMQIHDLSKKDEDGLSRRVF